MLGRGHGGGGNLGPLDTVVAVEVAHLKTGDEQPAQRAVEVGLPDITTTHSLRQVTVFRTALYIGAGQHGLG